MLVNKTLHIQYNPNLQGEKGVCVYHTHTHTHTHVYVQYTNFSIYSSSQQLHAIIAASVSIKSSQKLKKILEVNYVLCLLL